MLWATTLCTIVRRACQGGTWRPVGPRVGGPPFGGDQFTPGVDLTVVNNLLNLLSGHDGRWRRAWSRARRPEARRSPSRGRLPREEENVPTTRGAWGATSFVGLAAERNRGREGTPRASRHGRRNPRGLCELRRRFATTRHPRALHVGGTVKQEWPRNLSNSPRSRPHPRELTGVDGCGAHPISRTRELSRALPSHRRPVDRFPQTGGATWCILVPCPHARSLPDRA